MAKLSEKQEPLLKELIDDLDGDTEALMGRDGIMNELRKRLIENMLDGEMTDHLGYAPHDPTGNGSGNSRNGRSSKKIQSKDGDIPLDIPRDRNATFEPQVVKKGQRRIDSTMPSMPPRYDMKIKPIKSRRDYRRMLAHIETLMDAKPDSREQDELEILATLVEAYEEKHFPIPDAHPLQVIRFVMEQNGMINKDLMPYIGSSGRVSEVMSGRRPLTINMIRKFHKGLGIPADALLTEYDVA